MSIPMIPVGLSDIGLSDVGFRIFCGISSDYEEYARSLSDFNIFDQS